MPEHDYSLLQSCGKRAECRLQFASVAFTNSTYSVLQDGQGFGVRLRENVIEGRQALAKFNVQATIG